MKFEGIIPLLSWDTGMNGEQAKALEKAFDKMWKEEDDMLKVYVYNQTFIHLLMNMEIKV